MDFVSTFCLVILLAATTMWPCLGQKMSQLFINQKWCEWSEWSSCWPTECAHGIHRIRTHVLSRYEMDGDDYDDDDSSFYCLVPTNNDSRKGHATSHPPRLVRKTIGAQTRYMVAVKHRSRVCHCVSQKLVNMFLPSSCVGGFAQLHCKNCTSDDRIYYHSHGENSNDSLIVACPYSDGSSFVMYKVLIGVITSILIVCFICWVSVILVKKWSKPSTDRNRRSATEGNRSGSGRQMDSSENYRQQQQQQQHCNSTTNNLLKNQDLPPTYSEVVLMNYSTPLPLSDFYTSPVNSSVMALGSVNHGDDSHNHKEQQRPPPTYEEVIVATRPPDTSTPSVLPFPNCTRELSSNNVTVS